MSLLKEAGFCYAGPDFVRLDSTNANSAKLDSTQLGWDSVGPYRAQVGSIGMSSAELD